MCIRDSPPLPDKRLRHTRRPVSSSASDSARTMMPTLPDESVQGGNCETVPGSAQFKLRAPEAVVHVRTVQAPSACYLESAVADIWWCGRPTEV
eukprot:13568207-Alexandrium_andersonii.AAC.1